MDNVRMQRAAEKRARCPGQRGAGCSCANMIEAGGDIEEDDGALLGDYDVTEGDVRLVLVIGDQGLGLIILGLSDTMHLRDPYGHFDPTHRPSFDPFATIDDAIVVEDTSPNSLVK